MGASVVELLIGQNQLYLTRNSLAEIEPGSIRYLSEYHPRQRKTSRAERIRIPRRPPRTTQRPELRSRTHQSPPRPMDAANTIKSRPHRNNRRKFVNTCDSWSRYVMATIFACLHSWLAVACHLATGQYDQPATSETYEW